MRSGFFENTTVYAEDFARAFHGILSNGVLEDSDNSLKAYAAGGLDIGVSPGYCWIEGHYGVADSAEVITLEPADGALPRIDRLVARLDMSERKITVIALTGEPADSPSAPQPVRDGTYYDMGLADISVAAGATEITDGDISDIRSDPELCGGVTARTADRLALEGKADLSRLKEAEGRIEALEAKKITVENLSGASAALPSEYRLALVTVSGYAVSSTAASVVGGPGESFTNTVAVPLIAGTEYPQTGISVFEVTSPDGVAEKEVVPCICSYKIKVSDSGISLTDISVTEVGNNHLNTFTCTVTIDSVSGIY